MIADIEPRPAVEGVLLHARDIIGHEIVAEAVALVGRAPRRAVRLHRKANAIADAGGEQLLVLAVRIERQHRGAVGLIAPGGARAAACCARPSSPPGGCAHALGVIAGGADRHQHPLVVRREDDVAGRMSVTGRQLRNDGLWPSGGFHVAANDRESARRCRCWRHRSIADCRRSERRRCRTGHAGRWRRSRSCRASLRRRRRAEHGYGRRGFRPRRCRHSGATRMMRGPLRPSANNSILNPGGTCGAAPVGLVTTRDIFAAGAVAPGCGRSCGLIRRTVPGLSLLPASEGVLAFANAGLRERRTAGGDQNRKL